MLSGKDYTKFIGGGRNWIILVFSLLLAFFMWSIMKLSGQYSSYVRYKLEVTSNIPGRSNMAVSTDVLIIEAKSSGFEVLQNSSGGEGKTLLVDGVDSRFLHMYDEVNDLFYLVPDDIKQRVQDALGADVQVVSFATDTLFFKFPQQDNKMVPVVAVSMIKYEEQYMPYAEMVLRPDSITVYGPKDILFDVKQVVTETIKGSRVKEPLTGVVQLKSIGGVRFSQDEVLYSIEVGRYVERSLNIPITIENAPSYANVAIIPQEVTVKFRQPFYKMEELKISDFSVVIDYDEVLRSDVVRPRLVKKPKEILWEAMEPKYVECVL